MARRPGAAGERCALAVDSVEPRLWRGLLVRETTPKPRDSRAMKKIHPKLKTIHLLQKYLVHIMSYQSKKSARGAVALVSVRYEEAGARTLCVNKRRRTWIGYRIFIANDISYKNRVFWRP